MNKPAPSYVRLTVTSAQWSRYPYAVPFSKAMAEDMARRQADRDRIAHVVRTKPKFYRSVER